MKKIYYLVLTLLTIAMLALLTFARLNETGGWVDLTPYAVAIGYISEYGPMVLLCLFAFGGLIGKVLLSKIFFVLILILLVVFTVAIFAPDFIVNIIGKGTTASIF